MARTTDCYVILFSLPVSFQDNRPTLKRTKTVFFHILAYLTFTSRLVMLNNKTDSESG